MLNRYKCVESLAVDEIMEDKSVVLVFEKGRLYSGTCDNSKKPLFNVHNSERKAVMLYPAKFSEDAIVISRADFFRHFEIVEGE